MIVNEKQMNPQNLTQKRKTRENRDQSKINKHGLRIWATVSSFEFNRTYCTRKT